MVCIQVEWEEYWWEASDWAGMKELGAEKSGCSADGAAWRETWREAIAFDPFTGEPTVERTAHKWAHDAKVGSPLWLFSGYHHHHHVTLLSTNINNVLKNVLCIIPVYIYVYLYKYIHNYISI